MITLLQSPLAKYPRLVLDPAELDERFGKMVMTVPGKKSKGEGDVHHSLQVAVREVEGQALAASGETKAAK